MILKVGDDTTDREFWYTDFDHFEYRGTKMLSRDEFRLNGHDDGEGEVYTEAEEQVFGPSHFPMGERSRIYLEYPLQEYQMNPIPVQFFQFFSEDDEIQKAVYTDVNCYLLNRDGDTVQAFRK